MRDKLLAALRQAAQHAPGAVPGVAEVAVLAQVSEAVVRRHLGPPENFAALLAYQAPAHETRERIIASAARVFGQKGFQRASLDEVAADAGMTKGAIYWHFKSKNDLFFAMLDERFRQHTSPLMGDLQSLIRTGADPLTTMLSLYRDGLRRVTGDPEWARLYLECLSLARDTEVRERLSAFYDRVWEVSAQLTSELQANGLAPTEADPHTAAIFWSALFDGLVLAWLIKGDALDLERTTENIFRMLWRGIAPAPAQQE